MIIGTAPGEEEVRRGEPFVGPSGRQLAAALKWAGWGEAPICKLNVCNCRTLKVGATKLVNRDPTKVEARECLNRIVGPLLEGYQGLVLILGAVAYKYLTDKGFGSFSTARGHRLQVKEPLWKGETTRAVVKPPRVCACGAALAPRRRKCDQCRLEKAVQQWFEEQTKTGGRVLRERGVPK